MKILLAEDERTERVRLQKFLKGFGYEVISCKDGLEAWEAIQSKRCSQSFSFGLAHAGYERY